MRPPHTPSPSAPTQGASSATRRALGCAWLECASRGRARHARAILAAIGASVLIGCASAAPQPRLEQPPRALDRFAFAVYSSSNRLLQSPIELLDASIARRHRTCDESAAGRGTNPITDVFVLSHGWNFLLDESIGLYEGYRAGAESDLAKMEALGDACYEPFFIFVSWSSVTRPLSEALRSISPYALPSWVLGPAELIDAVVFHLPSNWGETQDAFDIALGDRPRDAPRAWSKEALAAVSASAGASAPARPLVAPSYRAAMAQSQSESLSRKFEGYDVPVALLIEELIRMRLAPRRDGGGFRLHTIGHSYGAKLISLATFDAAARARIELDPSLVARGPLVDSMLLFNPAMKVAEMYRPLYYADPEQRRRAPGFPEIASRIGRKGIVYTRNDSATGWVYALSQLVINNEALGNPRSFDTGGMLAGALDLPEKIVRTAAMTAYADAMSIATAPIQMIENVVARDRRDIRGQVGDVLRLPLYVLDVHQAMGNRGLRRAGDTRRYDPLAPAWLTEEALDMIESERDYSPGFLLAHSAGLATVPLPLEDAGANVFHTFDAADVYTGCFGVTAPSTVAQACNLVPPGAHGDIRAYEKVGDAMKRERTLRFIYNFTRR